MISPVEGDLRCCAELLPSVSRTFAFTIRVLPRNLRESVTVAYLLCRMADVLEDATTVDPEIRIEGLERFARALADQDSRVEELACSLDPVDRLPLADPEGERLLRMRLPVVRAYSRLAAPERDVISRWVQAMALGMSHFVARERQSLSRADGAMASRGGPADAAPADHVPFVLQTSEELRAYATYVAGTVGYMLTELFSLRLGKGLRSPERLRELALPFGLGLQFTNILQDLAEDRRRGWSYVPEEVARRHGTSTRGLDTPEDRSAALCVVGELVREAAGYLDRAMEYILLLPRRAPRLRLFCLWPTFFALRTLVRVWGEDRILTGGEKIRITRRDIRQIVGRTSAACLWDGRLRGLYENERGRLDRRIALGP